MKLDATKETALEKLIWIGIRGHAPQDFSLKLRGKSTLSILSTEGIEDVYNYHRGQCKWWILYRNK